MRAIRNGQISRMICVEADLRDGHADEEQHADGRGELADGQVHQQHDAEMHEVDLRHDQQRDQDRHQDDHDGDGFHEHARHEQGEVQDEQDRPGVVCHGAHGRHHQLRRLLDAEYPAERRRRTDDDKDDRGLARGAQQDGRDLAQAQRSIDEKADHGGIEGRDAGDLRRGEDTEPKAEQ